MYINVRLENKLAEHNKFYDMTLRGAINGHTEVEIHSGRIGVTNVTQQPGDTVAGWSNFSEGLLWFKKQLKKKIAGKEYSLRTAKSDSNEVHSEIEALAYKVSGEEAKKERAEAYILSKWW